MKNAEKQLRRYSKKQKLQTIFVGITGHRDIDILYKGSTIKELSEKFRNIKQDNPEENVVLLTALATGPDQWAASAAIETGLDYIAVLPMDKEDYLRESVLSGLEGQLKKDEEHRFTMLLESAVEKTYLTLDNFTRNTMPINY